jgi:hypothetical protein
LSVWDGVTANNGLECVLWNIPGFQREIPNVNYEELNHKVDRIWAGYLNGLKEKEGNERKREGIKS